MSNELVLAGGASVVVANEPAQLPIIQNNILAWGIKKLDAARAEHEDLDKAWKEAKVRKWKYTIIESAAKKALKRVSFYEKVVAALQAGFMLFPPVEKADVIAIRTKRKEGDHRTGTQSANWSEPRLHEKETEAPALGDGRWVSPWQGWIWVNAFKDENGKELTKWRLDPDLDEVEFPVSMAKPEIIQATGSAMEQKFFDEIRLFPFTKKRGDPVLLGVIVDKSRGAKWQDRRLYFMISWRVNEGDF
jgi:hypothetical protein